MWPLARMKQVARSKLLDSPLKRKNQAIGEHRAKLRVVKFHLLDGLERGISSRLPRIEEIRSHVQYNNDNGIPQKGYRTATRAPYRHCSRHEQVFPNAGSNIYILPDSANKYSMLYPVEHEDPMPTHLKNVNNGDEPQDVFHDEVSIWSQVFHLDSAPFKGTGSCEFHGTIYTDGITILLQNRPNRAGGPRKRKTQEQDEKRMYRLWAPLNFGG
jgi:hypothetical protein